MHRLPPNQPAHETPSIGDALIFRAKVTALQARRLLQDRLSAQHVRHRRGERLAGAQVIAECRTKLWAEGDERELSLQAGKVHNLRLAVRRLDGVEVPAGAVFSFWAQVGRASRRRGYAHGRELREGCIIPSTGGGLCQLSNALYDAALKAGFEIIERHAHTQVVQGSLAESGRDATVFWNYVDLRWRSTEAFRIEAKMDGKHLTVRLRAGDDDEGSRARRLRLAQAAHQLPLKTATAAPNSCFSCGVSECFRQVTVAPRAGTFGRTAFLLDEYWTEYDRYVQEQRSDADLLCLPLDGKRFGKPNYAWTTEGFRAVKERRLVALRRSFESRRLAQQGAERQRALLRHAEQLAAAYARLLTYDVTHVVVMQHLLPLLWKEGLLGGRSFDVLMTNLPLRRLHERLDEAAALHPESATLADFRADEKLVRVEEEALRNARRIVTPHSEIAALYPSSCVLLPWAVPPRRSTGARGDHLVFPASALGRKGAYEVREVAGRLGLRLAVAGPQLEGADFWRGVAVEHRRSDNWLDGARAVVLPAFVEHRPRRLLEALACGVPVIASTACGLESVAGVTTVRAGDAEALHAEVEKLLA